jgi:hypothetical protein
MKTQTDYQKFIKVLYEAYDASLEVDNFDLDSSTANSKQVWNSLVKQQARAFNKMCNMAKNSPIAIPPTPIGF